MNTKCSLMLTAAAVALSTLGITAFADTLTSSPQKKRSAADMSAMIKRGEYLVHQVGMCIDCHSPRGEQGEFIPNRHLTGAPIPFAPTVPMPEWAPAAPPIAGMPAGWSEDAMVQFLMKGERPNHLPPARPPMPPYRLSKPDAEAVAAYVHSLKNAAR